MANNPKIFSYSDLLSKDFTPSAESKVSGRQGKPSENTTPKTTTEDNTPRRQSVDSRVGSSENKKRKSATKGGKAPAKKGGKAPAKKGGKKPDPKGKDRGKATKKAQSTTAIVPTKSKSSTSIQKGHKKGKKPVKSPSKISHLKKKGSRSRDSSASSIASKDGAHPQRRASTKSVVFVGPMGSVSESEESSSTKKSSKSSSKTSKSSKSTKSTRSTKSSRSSKSSSDLRKSPRRKGSPKGKKNKPSETKSTFERMNFLAKPPEGRTSPTRLGRSSSEPGTRGGHIITYQPIRPPEKVESGRHYKIRTKWGPCHPGIAIPIVAVLTVVLRILPCIIFAIILLNLGGNGGEEENDGPAARSLTSTGKNEFAMKFGPAILFIQAIALTIVCILLVLAILKERPGFLIPFIIVHIITILIWFVLALASTFSEDITTNGLVLITGIGAVFDLWAMMTIITAYMDIKGYISPWDVESAPSKPRLLRKRSCDESPREVVLELVPSDKQIRCYTPYHSHMAQRKPKPKEAYMDTFWKNMNIAPVPEQSTSRAPRKTVAVAQTPAQSTSRTPRSAPVAQPPAQTVYRAPRKAPVAQPPAPTVSRVPRKTSIVAQPGTRVSRRESLVMVPKRAKPARRVSFSAPPVVKTRYNPSNAATRPAMKTRYAPHVTRL